jgi:peptide/nickel transport system permease protein
MKNVKERIIKAEATIATKAKKRRGQEIREVWRRFRKNPIAMAGLVMIIGMFVLAALADVIAPSTEFHPGYDVQNLRYTFIMPSLSPHEVWRYNEATGEYEHVGGTGQVHIFGTDNLGRDVFARIAHCSRITLMVGFIVVSVSMFAGVTLGAIAGFYGRYIDNIIMRIIDIILAMPTILLAIAIASALMGTAVPGIVGIMIAVGVGAIPGFARITRAQVLSLREQEFIEAARSAGASDRRLIFRHIIPNCTAPIIVEATMGMAGAIASAAALSFLGLGISPPTPEWGAMLAGGRGFLVAGYWHLTVFPGLAIAMIIFSLNMMGDGLRDAFDPRLRGAGFSKKRFKRILRAREQEFAGGEV